MDICDEGVVSSIPWAFRQKLWVHHFCAARFREMWKEFSARHTLKLGGGESKKKGKVCSPERRQKKRRRRRDKKLPLKELEPDNKKRSLWWWKRKRKISGNWMSSSQSDVINFWDEDEVDSGDYTQKNLVKRSESYWTPKSEPNTINEFRKKFAHLIKCKSSTAAEKNNMAHMASME